MLAVAAAWEARSPARGPAARARRPRGLTVRIVALDEATAPAWQALFEACGSACFCRYWHFEGTKNDWLERCARRPEDNRDEQLALMRSGAAEARGLLALERRRRDRLDEARAARAAPEAAATGRLPSARPRTGRRHLEHRLPSRAARPTGVAAWRARSCPRPRSTRAPGRAPETAGARHRGVSARGARRHRADPAARRGSLGRDAAPLRELRIRANRRRAGVSGDAPYPLKSPSAIVDLQRERADREGRRRRRRSVRKNPRNPPLLLPSLSSPLSPWWTRTALGHVAMPQPTTRPAASRRPSRTS